MQMVMKFMDAHRMLGCVWQLYKKYAVRELTEAEIEQFTKEAQSVYQSYKSQFTKDIVLAFICEVERAAKCEGLHDEYSQRGKKNYGER